MCKFCDLCMESRLVLVFTLVGTLVTLYQKIEKLKANLDDIKSKCEAVPKGHNEAEIWKKTVAEITLKESKCVGEIEKLRGEFDLYKKDMTGLVDYAYNGRIVSIGNTETYETEGLEILGFRIKCGDNRLEGRILETSVMPGDCWPFKGHKGSAVIELVDEIIVNKVSLEHASRDLLSEGAIASAPYEFSLWGLHDNGNGHVPPHSFGNFTYRLSGPEVQTFVVQNPSTQRFKEVEFRVHSNHGHPDYTCVYRVRVHGIGPKAPIVVEE